jgi:hypothetical protein
MEIDIKSQKDPIEEVVTGLETKIKPEKDEKIKETNAGNIPENDNCISYI